MELGPGQRRLTPSVSVQLCNLQPDDGAEGPLLAINWFNTRSAMLYRAYTLLAAAPLSKTGSRLFFRARHRSIISGARSDRRDMLLIVRYPSPERFLDLLANRYFQLVSILRVMAVSQFSFVLNRPARIAFPKALEPNPDPEDAYAVHHFRSDRSFATDLLNLSVAVDGIDVSMVMASEAAVQLQIKSSSGCPEGIPFVTDRVVLFSAKTFAFLEAALTSQTYRDFCADLDWSYLATLERTG